MQCFKLKEKMKIGREWEEGGRGGDQQGYEAIAVLADMAKRLSIGPSGGGKEGDASAGLGRGKGGRGWRLQHSYHSPEVVQGSQPEGCSSAPSRLARADVIPSV